MFDPETIINISALETQGNDRSARGDLDVTNLMNNPAVEGEGCVFGLGLAEQRFNGIFMQVRPFADNRTDALVVGHNSI